MRRLKELTALGIIGILLVLPSTAAATATYEVNSGDTLWGISRNYNISVNELMHANGLSSDIIHPGQALKVPGSSPESEDKGEPTQEEGNPSPSETADHGEYLDWSEVKNIYNVGDTATVTDLSSGLSFTVQRNGGSLHADSEPRTAEDTAVMKEIYGGSWSWESKPIIVSINEQDIAAAMNGMPHGRQNIRDNNFSGHFCIHFKDSRNHSTNRINPHHQDSVKKAAGIN